jgi:hypothetical protein
VVFVVFVVWRVSESRSSVRYETLNKRTSQDHGGHRGGNRSQEGLRKALAKVRAICRAGKSTAEILEWARAA